MPSKDRLEQLVAQLESVLKGDSPDRIIRADSVLAEIAELEDPQCIEKLVPLFSNDENEDDLMFSMVHVIEAFETELYVDHLVRSLGVLSEKSPRWARILHMGILNSPPASAAYRRRLQQASETERRCASNVLRSVVVERPEFGARVSALLSQL